MIKKKLIVDALLFQTPAWHRGMGKYSLELLVGMMAVGSKRGWDAVEIVLSKRLQPDPVMIKELKKRLPAASIVQLDLLPNEIGNETITPHNRKVVDTYTHEQVEAGFKVDFLILSLMQGEICPTFPSIDGVTKLLILYDLIPLMFHEVYLQSPITRVEYLTKIGELFRADKYFAISKTVGNDLATYLGINKHRIASIDGGPINHSRTTKKMASIPHPFILMPTGNDLRKNNRRAILGFKEFNRAHRHKYTLVITSFFKKNEITRLSALCEQILFTGNVSGEELNYLYEESEGVLFPPEYEGLGLPILEAIEKDKPIACSNISVFKEMSKSAFYYFNPQSIVEIQAALDRMIKEDRVNKVEYRQIQDRYTWQKTVDKLLEALPDSQNEQNEPRHVLDIFCPDPRDGQIGKAIQSNHAELSRHFEPRYFAETKKTSGETRINYLPYIADYAVIVPGVEYDAQGVPVYHLSNSESCANILLVALAVPGIVVLHDASLDELWAAAVQQGLIHASRLKLEQTIGASVKDPSFLVSLVASNRVFITFEEAVEKKLKQLAKNFNSTMKIIHAKFPVNELVYSTTLTEKPIPITFLAEGKLQELSRRNFTDFRQNDVLSKSKTVVVEQNNSYRLALMAMEFGAVPFIPISVPPDLLRNEGVFRYTNITAAKKEAREEAQNDATYPGLSRSALTYVHENHTHQNFAALLLEAFNDEQQNGETYAK